MKFSIVLSAQPTRFEAVAFRGDFERNLAHIAALGYDGVELAIRDPALVDGPALLALLDRHALAVPAVGTGQAWGEEHLSFTDPDPGVRRAAVERACAHVPFAAQAGAQIVIGLLRGVVQPGVTHAQAVDWLVQALRHSAAAAAPEGVRLCLEPLNRYETGLIHDVADGLALIERVGADNLGLLLDTFHMNIEEPDLAGAIRAASQRLFHFHVADSNRRYPGAGHVDFGHLLAVLAKVGYTGYVSGEFMPLPDADTAAEQAIAHLRSVAPPQAT
jgi:sugar phosphate isomerase/epimerase